MNKNKNGIVFWITGLPGSGKSNISKSIFIGDNDSDIVAGLNCFINSYYYEYSDDDEFKNKSYENKNYLKNPSEILDLFSKYD